MKHYGDITLLSGYTLPPVDIITGGSPCQDLSVAGLGKGLSGKRSGLFMEQVRICKEMREHDKSGTDNHFRLYPRPRFLVWENVAGALTSNNGNDFATVLNEIIKIAEQDAPDVPLPKKGKWTKAGCVYDELEGWSVAWRIHNAKFWGTPQRRTRVAVVADFGGLAAPEILFERKGLQRDYGQSEAPGAHIASAVKKSLGIGTAVNTGFARWEISDTAGTVSSSAHKGVNGGMTVVYGMSDYGNFKNGVAPLRARGGDYGNGSENLTITGGFVRRLTPLESERLQGFPDNWTDIGEWEDTAGKKHKESTDAARYKSLGNSLALPFWQWLARRICAQYVSTPTIGSLFDGIGGFPLVFQRAGANPVWASEIEEFPIAVTKRHFPEGG